MEKDKEKKGKKITAIIALAVLIVIILLLLARCGAGGSIGDPTGTTENTTTPTTAATTAPFTEAPTTEGVEVTEPSTEATESTTEPVTEPTEGTQPTTENTAPPTEPSEPVVEPTEESTEPSTTPTEPAVKPSEPVVEPTEPPVTEPPVTEPPVTEPPHSHSYSAKVTAPTCTADGYTTYTCSCGSSYTDNKTSAVGHSWGSWVTVSEPTESSTGTAERKCSVCGRAESKTLDKLPESHKHSYNSSVTTEATCTKDGVKTFTCSCGSSYTESIPAMGHDYSAVVTAATCTNDGYTTYVCSRCGDSYTADVTSATGHSYSVTSTQAGTCCEEGSRTYTCSCGASYTESTGKSDHSWEHVHTDEVGHEEWYYVCHCGGWRLSVYDDPVSFQDHLNKVKAETGTTAGHSYLLSVKLFEVGIFKLFVKQSSQSMRVNGSLSHYLRQRCHIICG